MFKVLKESPQIPEALSSEGKDFLRCCFRRNPAERPSASMLLEHPFVKNPHHVEVPVCTEAFNGLRLAVSLKSDPLSIAYCSLTPIVLIFLL